MKLRKLMPFVKVGVSVAAISLVLSMSDREKVLDILASLNWWFLVIPFLLLQLQTLLSTLKWRLILRHEGEDIHYWFLAKTYFIGNFFSLFLPSSIGGDFYRVMLLKGRINNAKKSTSSVLFERLTGLFALLCLALIGAYLVLDDQGKLAFTGVFIAFVLGYFLGLVVLKKIGETPYKIINFLRGIGASLLGYSVHGGLLTKSLVISLVFQTMIIAINFLYCTALVFDIAIGDLFVIVPLAYITDMIPISINGIGVRDSAFAFLFHEFNYPIEYAFTLSLLIVGMRYISAFSVGGVLFLLSRGK